MTKEQQAITKIAELDMEKLIEAWELLEARPIDDISPVVRGWFLDVFEARNETAFLAWLDSADSSPRNYYL